MQFAKRSWSPASISHIAKEDNGKIKACQRIQPGFLERNGPGKELFQERTTGQNQDTPHAHWEGVFTVSAQCDFIIATGH